MDQRRRRLTEYGITAGTLGSTSAQTLMVTVFPVLLAEHARSAIWVGFAIAGEGLFALLVPFWAGALSDRIPEGLARRFGRRSVFLLLSAPVMAVALCATPFLSGYWILAGVGLVFFAALHAYLTPLWALLIDAVPDDRRARVQGVRGVLHAAGLGYGLVAAGLLFALWRPLPFLLAALLLLVTTAATWAAAPRRDSAALGTRRPPLRGLWRDLRRRPAVRWFLVANALWNGAVDGIRPYFFVFAMVVVGIGVAEASLTLAVLVAGLGIGSFVLGRLGDRHDRERLLRRGVVLMGVAMAAGVFIRGVPLAVVLLALAGVGAAAVVALPYPIYAGMVGQRSAGRDTGIFVVSLGAGRMLAPLLVGAAIDVGARALPELRGYPLMWPMSGVLALAGALALTRVMRIRRRPRTDARSGSR